MKNSDLNLQEIFALSKILLYAVDCLELDLKTKNSLFTDHELDSIINASFKLRTQYSSLKNNPK